MQQKDTFSLSLMSAFGYHNNGHLLHCSHNLFSFLIAIFTVHVCMSITITYSYLTLCAFSYNIIAIVLCLLPFSHKFSEKVSFLLAIFTMRVHMSIILHIVT